jgi:ABC-type transporter lipoprotein component MlaA
MFDVETTLSEPPVSDPSAVAQMDTLDSINNSIRSDVDALKKPKVSSFDDVFRQWGFGCGVYLVFPLVGPGTGRELIGKVTELPLQPETYVQPIVLVRVAASIHKGLEDANRAKPFLQGYNLSTESGKEQYYNVLRTAILSQSQCVDDDDVKTEAEKAGLQVTDEE